MRRFAVALVAVVAALAVPLGMPGAAVADPIVIPPGTAVEIPGAFAGAGTVEVCTASTMGTCAGVAAAGYGAYQGTCYALGKIFHGGSCNVGSAWHNTVSWVGSWFGANGDNRTVTIANSALAAGYSGYIASFSGSTYMVEPAAGIHGMGYNTGSQTTGVQVHFDLTATCVNTLTGALRQIPLQTNVAWNSNAGIWGAATSSNAISCPAPEEVSQVSTYVPSGTGQKVENWYNDRAPNSPLSITITVTCRAGSVTGTGSATTSWTPTVNGTPPPIIPPDCQTILPGSHIDKVVTSGGRTGTTEFSTTSNTFTSTAKSTYPLCTDSAPVTGCWLDLKKLGQSCFGAGAAFCAGWTDPASIGDYTCNWGPYKVAISVCQTEYSTIFDTEVQAEPLPDASAGGSASYCNFSWGIVFNPAAWVVAPLKCVFIPTHFPTLTGVVNPIPAGWFPVIPSLLDGGCGAVTLPSLNFGPLLPHTGTLTLFNSCSAPWPTVHVFTYYGLLASVLMGGGFRAMRMVLKAFGVDLDSPVE